MKKYPSRTTFVTVCDKTYERAFMYLPKQVYKPEMLVLSKAHICNKISFKHLQKDLVFTKHSEISGQRSNPNICLISMLV